VRDKRKTNSLAYLMGICLRTFIQHMQAYEWLR